MLARGVAEWKEKAGQANQRLAEAQAMILATRGECARLQRALQREVGEDVPLARVLEEGGDWKGRAQQISLLKVGGEEKQMLVMVPFEDPWSFRSEAPLIERVCFGGLLVGITTRGSPVESEIHLSYERPTRVSFGRMQRKYLQTDRSHWCELFASQCDSRCTSFLPERL